MTDPVSTWKPAGPPAVTICSVCGATLNQGQRHKHERRGWKPRYDDFEGALEGYESEPGLQPSPCALCHGDGEVVNPGNADSERKTTDWLPPVACPRCGETGKDPNP